MNDFELTKNVVKRVERNPDGDRPIPNVEYVDGKAVVRVRRPGQLPEVKKIFLKYQKPPYDKEGDLYVDLDSHSGGYPYATNVLDAHDFKTVEEARRYRGKFDEFDIVEVTFRMEEKVLEKWEDKSRYQVEAQANGAKVIDKKMGVELALFYSIDKANAYAKQLNDAEKYK